MITHSRETPYRCKLENEQRRLQTGHVLLLQCLIPGQLLSKREKEERESKLSKGTGP